VPISTFLNGRPPTRLRGAQFLSFTATASIQRRTATSDVGGGAAWTWSTIATAPCRIYPVSLRGRPGLVGGALDEHSTHFCQMPAGTDVTTSDRVLIGSGTYDVTMILDATDELSRRIEVMQT
jgi:hypothetical protein